MNESISPITQFLGIAVVTASTLFSSPAPSASAQPCPDIDVVFARGTDEPPGVGQLGQEFVDALRSQAGARSVEAYGVNYPASNDFGGGLEFARTVVEGIKDARDHIMSTATNCPSTKMVLGGYSQGAAVIGFVTAAVVPDGVPPEEVPAPMPPQIADHVAAVALFGKPSNELLSQFGAPEITIGPRYAAKTLDVCAPSDAICAGSGDMLAHLAYKFNGMIGETATAVVRQL